MEKTGNDPSDYLASLPDDVRGEMQRLDAAITRAMGDHDKAMWEGRFWGGSDQRIIGYGDYRYTRSDRRTVEWFIVGLAAQRDYLSVYVNAADEDGYLTDRYADRLGRAKVGRSSVSFKTVDDIELDVLVEMVERAASLLS